MSSTHLAKYEFAYDKADGEGEAADEVEENSDGACAVLGGAGGGEVSHICEVYCGCSGGQAKE